MLVTRVLRPAGLRQGARDLPGQHQGRLHPREEAMP